MIQAVQTRKCYMCCRNLTLDQFQVKNKRRQRRCIECDEIRSLEAQLNQADDWAVAFRKSLLMRLNHADNPHRNLGQATAALTPHVLSVLMRLQNQKCAMLGYEFVMPPPGVFSKNSSFNGWVNSVPMPDRLLTPILVRARSEQLWVPGNVTFITKAFEPLYQVAAVNGNLPRLREHLQQEPLIYDNEQIQEALLEQRERKIDLIRQGNEQH